jgi:hypothetical protein
MIERRCMVEPADLAFDAVGSQQIARRSVGADDAELNITVGKLVMQLTQHA